LALFVWRLRAFGSCFGVHAIKSKQNQSSLYNYSPHNTKSTKSETSVYRYPILYSLTNFQQELITSLGGVICFI
jgi:hypothetical protein